VDVSLAEDQKVVSVNFNFKPVFWTEQNLVPFFSTSNIRPCPHDLAPN
tara:strand:- start:8536 stop:8679 length:144 start_codon:yes stop_codon:yes gene_type:complete